MKLGFIGFGNIAIAMTKGFLLVDPSLKDEIYCSAAHYDKCKKNAELFGITALPENKQTAVLSNLVILACKPYQVKDVLTDIKEELKGKMLISVAAGITFEDLTSLVDPSTHVMNVCPNTPVSVAKGVLVVEDKYSFTEDEVKQFTELFSKIGLIEYVKTKDLSIAGSIAGCTPAYTAMYIEALGDAGVKHGLTRPVVYRLVSKMVEGTGAMALAENVHPGALKDAVCSPGGTTIKGVASLEKDGFRGCVINAIDSVMKK